MTSTQYSTAFFLFFFNDTAPSEIYTLSLHDALPIFIGPDGKVVLDKDLRPEKEGKATVEVSNVLGEHVAQRSEEHTSELQSRRDLVCRLLLEKKKKQDITPHNTNRKRYEPRHTVSRS